MYRGWLGQHGLCCNTNTRQSFSNTRPSFWFSLKPSKARLSVWKARQARPSVLKQALVWLFCYRDFMEIWSVKSTVCSLQSSGINLFNLHFINKPCHYYQGTRPVTSKFVALVIYVKSLNLELITNIWKRKKKAEKRGRDLNWIENFTIESRYLKLCNEFRTFIRFMKATIYRPDYQKLLMCPLIKRPGQNSSFMTKTSRRAIMHRSRLKNIYIRKRSDKNWKEGKK